MLLSCCKPPVGSQSNHDIMCLNASAGILPQCRHARLSPSLPSNGGKPSFLTRLDITVFWSQNKCMKELGIFGAQEQACVPWSPNFPGEDPRT